MRDFIFNTKLGHFLFVVLFVAIIAAPLSWFLTFDFLSIMAGGAFTGLMFAILDSNTRWF